MRQAMREETEARAESRYVRMALGLLVVIMALAGCASTQAPATDPTSGAGDSEGSTGYPLTLRSPWGETVLEQAPARVATVSRTSEDLDALISLGVTPVFAFDARAGAPWLSPEQAAALSATTQADGPDLRLEDLAAAQPDLIIAVAGTTGLDRQQYEQLTKIAPVLTAEEQQENFQITWQENLRMIAEVIDREDTAEQVIGDVEQSLVDVRASHPEFADATATFVVNYGPGYGINFWSPTGSNAAAVLDTLGFRPNPHADEFVSNPTVSQELLSTLDGDLLFVGENVKDEGQRLAQDPLFQQLDVYRGGGYIPCTFDESGINWIAWGLRSSSALNLPWVVDQLATPAAAALAER